MALEGQRRDAESAHAPGEQHASGRDQHHEVRRRVARDRDDLHRRGQHHRRVDHVGHGLGLQVVELGRELGHEAPVGVNVQWLVELHARDGAAVDGGQPEMRRPARELDLPAGEHDPVHGPSELADRSAELLPLRRHHQGVDHGEAVLVGHHPRVRAPYSARELQPGVDALGQLQHSHYFTATGATGAPVAWVKGSGVASSRKA